jgi:hypothetical protein
MYYSVQSIHFDNYFANSKTAYLAMFAYTRARVEENKRRTLKRKVPMLVGGTRVPPTIALCFGPVKRNGFSGPKPTIFMTGESAGIRQLRTGFLERRGREKPPRACPPYIRSREPGRDRTRSWTAFVFVRFFLSGKREEHSLLLVEQEEQSKKERDTDQDGASVWRARVRGFVCGRTKRPHDLTLHI